MQFLLKENKISWSQDKQKRNPYWFRENKSNTEPFYTKESQKIYNLSIIKTN